MKTKDVLAVLTESIENKCKQIEVVADGNYVHVFGLNANGSHSVTFHHARLAATMELLAQGVWFDYDAEKKVSFMTIAVR